MEEPSVLDFVKSILLPWRYPRLHVPEIDSPSRSVEAPPNQTLSDDVAHVEGEGFPQVYLENAQKPGVLQYSTVMPWRSLLALVLALAAQFSLSPGPNRSAQPGVTLLILSVGVLIWAIFRKEWRIAPYPAHPAQNSSPSVNLIFLLAGLLLAAGAYLSFGNLQFKIFNTFLLLLSLIFTSLAFMRPTRSIPSKSPKPRASRIDLRRIPGALFSPWTLVWITAVALVIFFRFFRLTQVPPEMNSDHAEKILDVLNVLKGQTSVFFPSNGGREALHFYFVAALHKYFHIPFGYTILKLVTIPVGFLALPFIYLIGKETGNRRVGLLALTFAGIAYWPNVVSRVGMRLPFYMFFTAITFYFLMRGLQRGGRNDFILAGISIGLGFYGYSADRILPLLVVVAVALFLLHHQSSGQRLQTIVSTLALVLISIVLFLPLLRYMVAEPQGFLFRTLTRMGNLERPIEGPVWVVFLLNVWNAFKMFSWSGGVVWPISIPDYPALGVVSGALFYMGAGLLLIRYLRRRSWTDLFFLLSIPVLMLPSTLSLAFPDENPNLYRTGGVVVPVFLMVAFALDGLMRAFERGVPSIWGKRLAWGLAVFLVFWSGLQDYDLVFNKYYQQYRLSAWNSSEMGRVARDFIDLYRSPDTVWVMGYPYWVDTRLVALNAGLPGVDFQMKVEQLESTRSDPRPKLFILNPQDNVSLAALTLFYPRGWFQLYKSQEQTKDFILFMVPPQLPQTP
jgi:hypothetical protein